MNYQYAICSNCSTQAGYSEHISHKPTVIARFFFCLFIFIKLSQYMPSWVLVVMLQCIASWEREVDRSDAKAAGSFLCISIHLGVVGWEQRLFMGYWWNLSWSLLFCCSFTSFTHSLFTLTEEMLLILFDLPLILTPYNQSLLYFV